MLEIASQMILCLLLAALLGFIIGYLFCKATCSDKLECERDEASHHSGDHTETETHGIMSQEPETAEDDTASVVPERLEEPRGGEKDNLTRIKGIGLKIEETLNKQGIYHFDQIANWTEENIKWVDDNVAFPGRVKREQWVEQAKLLAEGKETEFSKRVDAGEVSTSKKS